MAAIPAASPDPRARQRGLLVLLSDTFLAWGGGFIVIPRRLEAERSRTAWHRFRPHRSIRAHDSAACW
jgi:hypothetical protein